MSLGKEVGVRVGGEAKKFFFPFYSGILLEIFLYKCIYIFFKTYFLHLHTLTKVCCFSIFLNEGNGPKQISKLFSLTDSNVESTQNDS